MLAKLHCDKYLHGIFLCLPPLRLFKLTVLRPPWFLGQLHSLFYDTAMSLQHDPSFRAHMTSTVVDWYTCTSLHTFPLEKGVKT